MGIKGLTKLLAEHAPRAAAQRRVEDYRGRVIAIAASLSIYHFLVVVGRKGTEVLTNEAGEVTSHLQGMLNRTVRLLEAGIKPVFVFDGEPPDLKKKEPAKRSLKRDDASKDLHRSIKVGDKDSIEKFSKRTVKIKQPHMKSAILSFCLQFVYQVLEWFQARVTNFCLFFPAHKKHNEDCERLLRLMGVPVVEIFTHSDIAHVEEVVRRLGLQDCFEGIICFETLNAPALPCNDRCKSHNSICDEPSADLDDLNESDGFRPKSSILCKPSIEAMEAAIQIANVDPKKTIIFDDSNRNIASGKAAGFHTVIVGRPAVVPGADLALESIHNIKELEIWYSQDWSESDAVLASTAVETPVVA